jgi:hypothetical protein
MTFDVFAELVYRMAETLDGSNFGDAPTGQSGKCASLRATHYGLATGVRDDNKYDWLLKWL